MSGMDMSDIGRFHNLEAAVSSLSDRILSLEGEVRYWKDRSDILEKYCKSLESLVSPDVSKSVYDRVCDDNSCEGTKESQDKVNDPEGTPPAAATANTAVANTEDYKLIAEKAKAENAVLREEIESLREAMRFIQVLSRPDSQSKTPKVTGSIQ